MPDAQTDYFSQTIASLFNELGVNPPFMETILLGDCRYVGRKFRAGGYQVIWWVENDTLEVFDQDGQSIRIIELEKNSKKISA
ncbi:MAG: hypothetical protein IT426_03830 [Pirellulales bacterium]|nr:hypothetical protein [Pirellulales bacterium]